MTCICAIWALHYWGRSGWSEPTLFILPVWIAWIARGYILVMVFGLLGIFSVCFLMVFGTTPLSIADEENGIVSCLVIAGFILLRLRINRDEKLELELRKELELRISQDAQKLEEATSQLKKDSEYIRFHKDIAVCSNDNLPVEESLQKALQRICEQTGWPVGHLYLYDKNQEDNLVSSNIWYLEDPDHFETFRNITQTTQLAPGIGLPGRVLESRKASWIMDVTKDGNFPRAKQAQDIGVRAGFGFPVLVGSEIVGVMEFFSAEALEPDPKLLETMENIGTQLGRVIERSRAEKEKERAQMELRRLFHRLQLVREDERTGIAREVHDELGQVLTTLKLEISLLERKLAKLDPELMKKTRFMIDLVDNTIQTVKRISSDLRPPILDALHLPDAIRWQGMDFEQRTGISVRFSQYPDQIKMDTEKATSLFRVFQETLTNIARHAQASKIYVNLECKNGMLSLQIQDNGKGITKKQLSDSSNLGIIGMRERAEACGGSFQIVGAPHKGTTVTIKIKI